MRIDIVLPKLGWFHRQLGRILRLPGGYDIICLEYNPTLSFTDQGLRRVTYEIQGDYDGGVILAFQKPQVSILLWILDFLIGIFSGIIGNIVWLLFIGLS